MLRLTDHPDMTKDVYSGRKATKQQLNGINFGSEESYFFPVIKCSLMGKELI